MTTHQADNLQRMSEDLQRTTEIVFGVAGRLDVVEHAALMWAVQQYQNLVTILRDVAQAERESE
jgi:hypothetical protein